MNKEFTRSLFSLIMAIVMVLSFAVIPSSAAKASLNKSSVTIVKGYSAALTVNGTNKKITWSSDNTDVASVSKQGKVTGKKLGTATVSASFGSTVLKCKVTVKAGTISASGNKLSVDVGKTASVSIKAVGLHDLEVTSSDNSVAKAALTGKFEGDVTSVAVKGIADGTAKIKIYAKGYEKSVYKYVEVKVGKGKPTEKVVSSGITVSADSIEVNENLTAKVTVSGSSDILKKLTIASTAKYKFDVTSEYDLDKGSVDVTVSGYVEGEGNLHIFDPNDKQVNINIPVTVTNNAYDVVVWNREPKKRVYTDIVYLSDNDGVKYYILEPKDADPASAMSLIAKQSGKYEYWVVYDSMPEKQLSSDVILTKSEKYNGKKVTRYLLVEGDYDEAYSNSAFGQYFGVYDYYKVYASKPVAAKYGDKSISYECKVGAAGKKEMRYILTDGNSERAASVWKAYIEKYKYTVDKA